MDRCPVTLVNEDDMPLAVLSIDIADGLMALSLADYNSLSEAELAALRIARNELAKLTRPKK